MSLISECQDLHEDNDENASFRTEVNLHDIIRDRKAERKLNAEQKRRVDLNRIREMTSDTGIDPLQLFPKEIWIQILDELLIPEDRRNAWNVHPLFRELMESTCIGDIFLPLVVKVDAFQNNNRGNLGSRYNEQLRLVSKKVKSFFDSFMDYNLKKNIMEMEVDPYETKGYVDLRFSNILPSHPKERQWLKNFVTSFSGEGENVAKSFFPRSLSVTFSSMDILGEDENLQEYVHEFKNDITGLLKNIGDQIWQFKLYLSGMDEVYEDVKLTKFRYVYIMLQRWLILMPNVKWLELFIEPNSGQMIHESSSGKKKFSKAKSVLRKNPFPHSAHLKRLSLQSAYAYHGYVDVENERSLNIYGIILKANQHIKMLDLRTNDTERILLPPHLTQGLQLSRFSALDGDFSDLQSLPSAQISLNRLKPMINYNWPLKTIILSIQANLLDDSLSSHSDDSSEQFSSESILSVFQFLQQFPTLEKVELRQLDEFNFYDIEKIGYLELPNLTELVLNITSPSIYYDDSDISFFFSLQFLFHCKKLKRISWKLVRPVNLEFLEKFEKESEVEMVDFRGGMRYLYDSNIWDVFPYLESVYVRVGSCEHEYFRKYIDVMSPQRFLNTHPCSRNNQLRNCVMLI